MPAAPVAPAARAARLRREAPREQALNPDADPADGRAGDARLGDAVESAEATLREARIAELATGFAIGELDEAELRELYEALKSDQPGSAGLARVAWEALGTVMDLRANLSHLFLDELAQKMKRETGGAKSDRFERDIWRRIGFARSGLSPVAAPDAPPRQRVRLRSVALATVAAVVIAALVALRWLDHAAVAHVVAVDGSAQLDGHALTTGGGVDRGLIAVPAGSRLRLAWEGGAQATIVGPAQAVAQTRGLSLPTGRAAIEATAGFALGLPDRERAVELSAGARAVVEIRGRRSLVGIDEGAAAYDAGTLVAGRAHGGGGGGDYAWIRGDAAGGPAHGLLAVGIDAPAWAFAATLAPAEDAACEFALTPKDGAATVLRLTPGLAVVVHDGEEVQRLELRGPPLAPLAIVFALDDGVARASLAGHELRLPAAPPYAAFAWTTTGMARVERPAFHTGPEPLP